MRILHFIDTLAAGGTERQLIYLLENLDRRRFEPLVVTIYDEHRHYEPTLRALEIPLYSLHHGSHMMQNRAWAVGRYLRLMWMLRPDIVHSWLHYANLIARCARPACPPYRLVTAIRSKYSVRQQRLDTLTAPMSDLRIVINQHIYPYPHQKNNTRMIHNAVPLHHFSTNLPSIRATQFPNTSFLTLTPARIDPNKGHITLLKALSQVKHRLPGEFKTIFIGEISSTSTQQELERAVETFSLQGLIQQLPATHEIAPYYQAADITILPSSSEAFPNVVLESFAAGKSVIISDAANSARLVTHGLNGWVFPTGNSEALAQCILEAIANSPEQRTEMGKAGQTVAAQFTVEKMVTSYTQLYEELATRS